MRPPPGMVRGLVPSLLYAVILLPTAKSNVMAAAADYSALGDDLHVGIAECSRNCLCNVSCNNAFFDFKNRTCSDYRPPLGNDSYAHYMRAHWKSNMCPPKMFVNFDTAMVSGSQDGPWEPLYDPGALLGNITTEANGRKVSETTQTSSTTTTEGGETTMEPGYEGPLFTELYGYRNNTDQKWCYATTTKGTANKLNCHYIDAPTFIGVLIYPDERALKTVAHRCLLQKSMFIQLSFHNGNFWSPRKREIIPGYFMGYVPVTLGICGPTFPAYEFRNTKADTSFYGRDAPSDFHRESPPYTHFLIWKETPLKE